MKPDAKDGENLCHHAGRPTVTSPDPPERKKPAHARRPHKTAPAVTVVPTEARIGTTNGRNNGEPTLRIPTAAAAIAVRVHRREQKPLVFPLEGARSTILIGRGEQADLRFRDDDRISRIHAMLRCDGEEWFFVDLGSVNGSFLLPMASVLDGSLKDAQRLAPGDPVPLDMAEALLFTRGSWLEVLTALPENALRTSTRSPAGVRFEEALSAVAPSRLPVFLLGPSGSGKTWAARVLHERSGRAGRFVSLNCARLPNDTVHLQSELLGHRRGAFTDAKVDRAGLFFEADGGTLFLDEVESLSPIAQGFFLDLLEDSGQLLPLGVQASAAPARPRVRVVSASKAPLQQSRLRSDLAHRLAAGELLSVPRLADRREDIAGLVELFLQSSGGGVAVAPEAMAALTAAAWTGEVRELRFSVEALADRRRRQGGVIERADVEQRLRSLAEAHGIPEPSDSPRTLIDQAPLLAPTAVPVVLPTVLLRPSRATREQIESALAATGGNIDQAAKQMGWARNTLTAKMDHFRIPRRNRPSGGT
ncbi:MAG: sigma 54-interacting transcriptional regulator [Deltaproteobacteria bacterium]|nr:sigma 54-interacting transcriptional regulator [Deltaproteobacteria bacterium]